MKSLFGREYLVRLSPLKDLDLVRSSDGLDVWNITGGDPQFLIVLHESLEAGMYRLALLGNNGSDKLQAPTLFVDYGQGFSVANAIPLSFREANGSMTAMFELAGRVEHIRFDPSTSPGTIGLKYVTIKRVSRTLYRGTSFARTLGRHVNSPSDAVRLANRSVQVLRRDGVAGLRHAFRRAASQGAMAATTAGYDEWVRLYDTFSAEELAAMTDIAQSLTVRPLISVLMPVYNSAIDLLTEAIESVRSQAYPNWQLCIADDKSTDPGIGEILRRYEAIDDRIKVAYRERNGHISAASNSALELVEGDWIALLDHDDLLRPNALLEVACEIARNPDCGLIYSDEDKIDERRRRYDAFFKPDFSIELLRSQNYFNHLTVHRADLVRKAGGWRKGYEGSQDHDLNLRIVEMLQPEQIRHIPKILYHWRAVSGSTAASGGEKNYAYTAGLKALKDHALRLGDGASAEAVAGLPFYRYHYPVPDPQPLVSLVIPTRDKVELIRGCVNSILAKTTYSNFEIVIVDNGSVEPETLEFFSSLADNPKVRVLSYHKPFNYSAINNFAVTQALGEIIGLVNNDIEVISPDWLTEMVSLAVQPEVGCVGAKLYYANDTIQHAGVICGLGGVAGHSHKYFPRASQGYFYRMNIVHEVSAVTAACLLVRKPVFQGVNGLEEDKLKIAFNDVDFCLKVWSAGYRNVWTPYAELYHLESVSRGAEDDPRKVARFNREIDYMKKKWGPILAVDPFYSPNLSINHEDYSLAFPPRVSKLPQAPLNDAHTQHDDVVEKASAVKARG